MAIIDKLWVNLICPKCVAKESESALDKGSGCGGLESYWEGFGGFELFNVRLGGGGRVEPEIVSATCKRCDVPARVETAYGFEKPEGF